MRAELPEDVVGKVGVFLAVLVIWIFLSLTMRFPRRTWQEMQMEAKRESVPVLDDLLFSWGLVLVAVEVMGMVGKDWISRRGGALMI